jgi:hypothetical protein
MEQHFYCCSTFHSDSRVFNNEHNSCLNTSVSLLLSGTLYFRRYVSKWWKFFLWRRHKIMGEILAFKRTLFMVKHYIKWVKDISIWNECFFLVIFLYSHCYDTCCKVIFLYSHCYDTCCKVIFLYSHCYDTCCRVIFLYSHCYDTCCKVIFL